MQLLSYCNQYCHATKYCSLIGSQHRRRRASTLSNRSNFDFGSVDARIVSMLIGKRMCSISTSPDATL